MKHSILILLFISSFKLISQVEKVSIKVNDTISIELTRESFKKKNKNIQYKDSLHLYSIDSNPVFGTNMVIPKHQLIEAKLIIKNKGITLNTSFMYDPWWKNKNTIIFKVKNIHNGIQLRGLFSSGAGSYVAEWHIIENKSTRTIITQDLLLLDKMF